jgi:prepilin-type N-terminal cleavage/methylation domain-containing protein
MPRRAGFTLVELLIVILIIAVLAAFLVPALIAAIHSAKETQCASNLRQIGTLAEVYRKNFGGPNNELPDVLGRDFHLKMINTCSENKDNALYQCPLEGLTTTYPDYRGPTKNLNAAASYRSVDPIAGDKIDAGTGMTNHGDPFKLGVNALTKGFAVIAITRNDAVRWQSYQDCTQD